MEKEFSSLKHRLDLYSTTSINPFLQHSSAPRLTMLHSHFSQALVLENSEEKIVQTGVEREIGKHLFSIKLEHDARVIALIPRYRSTLGEDSVNEITEYILIYEDLENKIIRHHSIPAYFSMHQYFGFKYNVNMSLLDTISENDILHKGTPLALTPSEAENNGYKYGVNLNTIMMSIPEISEDGFVISKSALEKLKIKVFERRTASFGENTFPLNIYGDAENYKPFPDIGEPIHPTGLVTAIRKYDELFSPALTSVNDVKDFNPMFDECIYSRDPNGIVIDIKAYHNPKAKKEVYKGAEKQAMKYNKALKRFYSEIVDEYENLVKEYRGKYGVDPDIDPNTTRLIVEAYVLSERVPTRNNIKKMYKNEMMDIYRVELTIEHNLTPNIGWKITSLNGDKGVIVEIREDEDMPMTQDGVRAEVICDPAATISRMNIARLYDQYFSGVSRTIQKLLIERLLEYDKVRHPIETLESLSKEQIQDIFSILISGIEKMNEDQARAYELVIQNKGAMIDIITESIEENVYILYNVEAKKKAYDVINDLSGTIFAPKIEPVWISTTEGKKLTKDKMLIAPMYFMELYKIADTFLANASSNVNHFGVPIGVSKANRYRLPYRNSPVRILSESETRLYTSYMDREAFIELKDRANSVNTHKYLYNTILNAPMPTNIDRAVNRDEQPYGEDKVLEIINTVFSAAGTGIAYKSEDEV